MLEIDQAFDRVQVLIGKEPPSHTMGYRHFDIPYVRRRLCRKQFVIAPTCRPGARHDR
ncbi:hypothetical protein [Pseudorhodoplanes sp.]|uniref:hypothetical protein n=1 Tax=Pseudorhodoplanes sp. TaxID=1934341 RepID=UPI003D13D749